MNAAYIIKKLDAALTKVGGMSRTAYLRQITVTGGDDLIGRPGAVTNVDTQLTPPPVYRQLGKRQSMLLSGGSLEFSPDDYKFTVSPTALAETTLENQNACLVLKDSAGNEEVLRIIYINTESIGGKTVVLNIFARTTSR